MMKDWVENAMHILHNSLYPVPQELNEIDWKGGLSDKSDRIAQHLSAFANYSGGGYLAFGIDNDGVSKPLNKLEMDEIVKKIGNISTLNLCPIFGGNFKKHLTQKIYQKNSHPMCHFGLNSYFIRKS